MFRLSLTLLLLSTFSATCALKVMNLNMYMNENYMPDAIRKSANQIKAVNPDIVALQETNNGIETMDSLLKFLGSGWSGINHCNGYRGIVTRHKILDMYEHVSTGINVRIQLNDTGLEISFWSVYLFETEYGPFEAAKGNSTTVDKILRGENKRIHDIVELIKHRNFVQQIKNSDNVPVIVAGGFNSPSDLDWTQATKSRHHGFVVDWPVTKLFSRASGMIDSFREIYPDPNANPGTTWTLYKKHHQRIVDKDRIDFIFYRGSLRAKSSYTYSGTTPVVDDGNWKANAWPSDHWALITEFERTPHKYENKPSFFISPEYVTGSYGAIDKCPMKIIH